MYVERNIIPGGVLFIIETRYNLQTNVIDKNVTVSYYRAYENQVKWTETNGRIFERIKVTMTKVFRRVISEDH